MLISFVIGTNSTTVYVHVCRGSYEGEGGFSFPGIWEWPLFVLGFPDARE